jgi:ketosteroid isomerase-like protein
MPQGTGGGDGPEVTEIGAVLDRYAIAYDGRRPTEFAQAFTTDGVLTLPDGVAIRGRTELAAFAAAAAGRRPSTHHFTTNRIVNVQGDRATSTSHVAAVSRVGDDVRLLLIGRYADELVRTGEGWRIAWREIADLDTEDLAQS